MNTEKSFMSILKSFDQKCRKNKIWYSLSNLTLLSAKTNKTYGCPKIVEVMMDSKSYNKFFKLYNENILDSRTRSEFYFSNPFYFENNFEYLIKINLIIKGSIEKTEKFYSIKNWQRQEIGFFKTAKNKKLNWKHKIQKIYFKFLNLFWSPLLHTEIESKIYDEKYNGFFIVNSFSKDINKNWIPTLTMELEEITWNEEKLLIIKESDLILNKQYGFDWQTIPEDTKKEEKYINKMSYFLS